MNIFNHDMEEIERIAAEMPEVVVLFRYKIGDIVYVLRHNKVFQTVVYAQFYKKMGSTQEKTYHLHRNRKGGKEEMYHVKEHEIFPNVTDLKGNLEIVEIENIEALQPFYEAGNAI